MVVDRNRQCLFRGVLADDVLAEEVVDLARLGELVERTSVDSDELLLDDLVAEVDALVADVDTRASDELLDLLLALSAERALEQVAALTDACHGCFPFALGAVGVAATGAGLSDGTLPSPTPGPHLATVHLLIPCWASAPIGRRPSARSRRSCGSEMIWSTRPYSSASSAVRILSRSMSWLIFSIGRGGVLGQHLLHLAAHPQDLVGLDLQVGDLTAAGLAVRLVDQDPRVRQGRSACPGVPAASSTAAAEAAWPMQTVWMSGLTNCIVS